MIYVKNYILINSFSFLCGKKEQPLTHSFVRRMKRDIGSILIGQRSIEHGNKLLNKVVEQKKKQIERLNYEKYKGVFEETAAFLKKKRALLYGGVAVNEMLPPPFKIYEPATLPDIDVLSPEPKKLANSLAKFLKKKGHEAVTVAEALHMGTFKVFADGIQVADITGCDAAAYKKLLLGSLVSSIGIKTVPPLFIRMSLHKIMAEPNDAHRWPNVYERLNYFYRKFPVGKCSLKKVEVHKENHGDAVKRVYDVLGQSNAVFLGLQELSWILDDPSVQMSCFKDIPPVQLLVDADPAVYAQELSQAMGLDKLTIHDYPADDFVPAHSIIQHAGNNLVLIFKAENCFAYNAFKGLRVAGIHTILYLFLSMLLSTQKHFRKMVPFLETMSDCLSDLQQHSKKSRRKLLEEFVSTCVGPSSGVITMRRQRFKRIRNKKQASQSMDL